MDILSIVLTVVGVIIVASLVGLVIRRFHLKVWQLVLAEVLGFVLLILGEGSNTGVLIAGIVLLTFGSAGLFYMWFLGGAKRQQAAYELHDEGGDEAHIQADTSDIAVPERGQTPIKELRKEEIRCPLCGSETVIRTAHKGQRVGRQFHMCTRYPECEGRIVVE